tara:strand:- start:3570 stop:4280 length:711 start_codon:yes stop_codon:yes gene_type:complete
MNTPCKFINPERIINLQYPISIISLGTNCYSRTFPERFHIYNYKNDKVRMPFDGCVTPYYSMCKLINTEFTGFDENLVVTGTDIINKSLGIKYNHERTTDILSVKIQLNKRKSQFIDKINNCIQKQSTIIFFLWYNNYPKELVKIIINKYPKLKFKIFILDDNIYSRVRPIQKTYYATYINIPKPSKNYIEWADRETSEGKQFEKKVLFNFLNFITEISGVQYDTEKIFNNRCLSV